MNKDLDVSNFRAIVSDYDGTLAGADFNVSDNVKLAISKWRNTGRFFSIATAKAFNGAIQNSCRDLQLSDPVIVHGGGEIIDPKSGRIIHGEYVPNEEVENLIRILEKTHYLFEVQTTDKAYASSKELQDLQPHKNYDYLDDLTIDKIGKVRIVTTNNDPEEVDRFIEELKKQFTDLNILPGHTPYSKGFDITSERSTKHLAVLKLAEILRIEPSQMIAIGDSMNDYPLFTACGYRVAMGNAPKELVEIADYIAPDYLHDGVSVFFNEILREK